MAYNFIAGHYAITIGGVSVGTTEEGVEMTPSFFRDPVKVDEFGDTEVDAVFRGYGHHIAFNLSEWNAAGRDAILHFYDSTIGTIANVGKLMVVGSLVKSLVLTPALSGTGQFTYTFSVGPDQNHGPWQLRTRLRVVRCSLMAYPDSTGNLYTRSGGA